MDSDSMQDKSVPIGNVSSLGLQAESNNFDSLEVIASSGDAAHELVEILTKVELDIACSSEKLANLDMLFILVASRENDFEAFALEEDQEAGPAVKALEFDLLYGIFYSEVRELESSLFVLQSEIVSSREALSSFRKLSDVLKEMEERFHDCEDSLTRCFGQVSDMKLQSANFKRILLAASRDEKCMDDKDFAGLENGDLSDVNAKIKMQTVEQQRNILRMLEKSLAREMDLEKKLTESRQNEEDLKLQMQQLLFCMEVESEEVWERLYEAENRAEILLGIPKELLGWNQLAQISMNGSTQRERDLRLKVQDLNELLNEKESALQVSETSSRAELVEKVSSLEQKVREFKSRLNVLKDSLENSKEFKVKVTVAEERATNAEAERKLLRESNMELDKEMNPLNSNIVDASEKVERLLKDSKIKRLHAVASAVASDEKQSMLECRIRDMETLITDLKSKVLKAENQTKGAEEKCMILSESNDGLTEETNFLRHRIQHLETSLHQADKAKKDIAKDIRDQSRYLADLVLQLASERERLHKLISSLAKEKKVALVQLQQMKDGLVTVSGCRHAKVQEPVLADNDSENGTPRNRTDGETVTSYETEDVPGDSLTNEIKTGDADATSSLDTLRNIDTRQLKFKYSLMAVVVLGIPALAAYLFQQ